MKKGKLAEKLMKLLHATINHPKLAEIIRKDGTNSFSRNRRLTSKRLVMLVLSGIRLPLKLATDALFKSINLC